MKILRTPLKRLARDQRGTSLVEFVLVLPLLLILLFGMIDFGKAINNWIDLTHLANEGSRWAAVDKWPDKTISLQQYVQQQTDLPELRTGRGAADYAPAQNGAQVCVTYPSGTANVGDPVKVTVKVNYRWLTVLTNLVHLPALGTQMGVSSTMRLEAKPTDIAATCYTPPPPS